MNKKADFTRDYIKGFIRISKEQLTEQPWLQEWIKKEFIPVLEKPIDINYQFTKTQLDQIRSLGDFDLTMFLSEINDHGIETALTTLSMILDTIKKSKNV